MGDTVKVGEIEGRLGVATVAEVTATQVVFIPNYIRSSAAKLPPFDGIGYS